MTFYLLQLKDVEFDPSKILTLSASTICLCLAGIEPAVPPENWLNDLEVLTAPDELEVEAFVTTAINELTAAGVQVSQTVVIAIDPGASFILVSQTPVVSKVTIEFTLDTNTLAMATGNEFHFVRDDDDVLFGIIGYNGVDFYFRVSSRLDPGGFESTLYSNTFPPGVSDFKIEWEAGNLGFQKLYIGGLLLEAEPLDNESQRVSDLRIGAVAGVDTGTSGQVVITNVNVEVVI